MSLENAPWNFPIGIELTFVPADYEEHRANPFISGSYNHLDFYEYRSRMHKMLKARSLIGNGNDTDVYWSYVGVDDDLELYPYDVIACETDPGCVETPTRVLTHWEDAWDVWHRVVGCASDVGLVPLEDHQETGMGHIHASVTRAQAIIIQRDLVHRPYLAWALQSPNQSKYGGSMSRGNSFDVGTAAKSKALQCTKSCIAVFRLDEIDHMEWRAFDAAQDWEQQEEHIAFIQRYYSWCIKNPRSVEVCGKKLARLEATKYRKSYDLCCDEIAALFKMLRLPVDRYMWYAETNMKNAFAWAKEARDVHKYLP